MKRQRTKRREAGDEKKKCDTEMLKRRRIREKKLN